MSRTRRMTLKEADARGIRFQRLFAFDEPFLVDYGCSRAKQGARRGRLTPNLAREYARTHDALQEVTEHLAGTRIIGALTPEQEAREEEAFQARIERWEQERIEEEIEAAYAWQHGDPWGDENRFAGWDAEEAYFNVLEDEEAHAYEVVRLARGIATTQVTPIER